MKIKGFLVLLLAILHVGLLNAAEIVKDGITYVTSDGQATVKSVDESVCGEVTIPQAIMDGKGPCVVTKIGDWAFSVKEGVTSVRIPGTVVSIGKSAFLSCHNIESIEFYGSKGIYLSEIQESAFYDCQSLKSIKLPESLQSIGESAFSYVPLDSITIPEGVTCIERGTFKNAFSLKYVHLPSTITEIKEEAFTSAFNYVNISDSYGIYNGCIVCDAEQVPITEDAFSIDVRSTDIDYKISYGLEINAIVPEGSIGAYKSNEYWRSLNIAGGQCAKPEVKFVDGKFILTCDTPGVSFDSDINTNHMSFYKETKDGVTELTPRFYVTFYAYKTNYHRSEGEKINVFEIATKGHDACDVNGDNMVDVGDITTLVNKILGKK